MAVWLKVLGLESIPSGFTSAVDCFQNPGDHHLDIVSIRMRRAFGCVLFARQKRFTLDEIGSLLELQDVCGKKSQVKDLVRKKLSQIDSKIDDLSRIGKVLRELDDKCTGSGDVRGCPIISALASPGAGVGEESESAE